MFLLFSVLGLSLFGQCGPDTLGSRTPQSAESQIILASSDLDGNFLSEVGNRWNNCGGTASFSTSFGTIIIDVVVEETVGHSEFAPVHSGGVINGGTVTLYTQYFTACCGTQTLSEENLKDELAHELGHVLGLDHTFHCSGAAMNGGEIEADGSVAPRSVTSEECAVADIMWVSGEEDCNSSVTCIPKRAGTLECCTSHSPIVIDLDRNGFRFSSTGRTVHFDLYGSGEAIETTWVLPRKKDVFLFNDINANGICDDGAELFGHGTRLILEGNILAPHGFAALAQFDHPGLGGYNDGVINELDEVWDGLSLWYDRNADGVCTPEETWKLYETPITRLEVNPSLSSLVDPHGNQLKYWARAVTDYGLSFDMVDVYFVRVFD